MKIFKGILYSIVAILVLGCLGIIICAMNPSLTGKLAEKVQQLSSGTQTSDDVPWEEDSGGGSYVTPDVMPQTVPEEVSGLAGYRPVAGDNEQIPQEEADNLGSILSPGETGEGLSFSEEFYPYYAMLDDTLKKLYRQVYANACALNTSFSPVVTATIGQAMNVIEAVYNDHPEIFWLDAMFSCKYLQTGICVEITLEYNSTANNLEAAKQDFDACSEEILAGAGNLADNYDREKYIHDALVQIVTYNASAQVNQSAYSALVLGESVCAGYSRAFQYLMQRLGIPCYYCAGFAGEDHAWNIVKQGGRFHNVDVTWDDTDPSTYTYYNKSDSDFASTHVRTGMSVRLPACTDALYNPVDGEGQSWVDAYINPDPQKPLTWHSRGDSLKGETVEKTEEEKKQENLDKAGIKAEDVLETLDKYYEDCAKRLKEAGVGDKQFTNVIPESLWNSIERAYSSGSYWNGYVDKTLKELKVENFLIQLQVQRLGGGYCRLYHNVYTY